MERLAAILTEGRGCGLCKRIIAIVKAANVLGLSFLEAFDKQPIELLQLLTLKAQDSFEEANLLVQTHPMLPAGIAQVLAESFLKVCLLGNIVCNACKSWSFFNSLICSCILYMQIMLLHANRPSVRRTFVVCLNIIFKLHCYFTAGFVSSTSWRIYGFSEGGRSCSVIMEVFRLFEVG